MQRIYIFIIITALVLAISYSRPIRDFFKPSEKASNTSPLERNNLDGDDSYNNLGIELYRIATRLSDLQGKASLLRMAREKEEWFKDEEYAKLDELIKATEGDLEKTKDAYQKTKEAYAKETAQRMLEEFSKRQ